MSSFSNAVLVVLLKKKISTANTETNSTPVFFSNVKNVDEKHMWALSIVKRICESI